MTNSLNKQWLLENIVNENWNALCEYLRDWYAVHCPIYHRDEVEGLIGSWVGRMVIVVHQIKTGNRCKWESTRIGNTNYRDMTPEEMEQDIKNEIDTKWDDALRIYETQMKRINNYPAAEEHVAEVVARLAKHKEPRLRN